MKFLLHFTTKNFRLLHLHQKGWLMHQNACMHFDSQKLHKSVRATALPRTFSLAMASGHPLEDTVPHTRRPVLSTPPFAALGPKSLKTLPGFTKIFTLYSAQKAGSVAECRQGTVSGLYHAYFHQPFMLPNQ